MREKIRLKENFMKFTPNTTSSTQRLELVNSFAEKIEKFCRNKIRKIYGNYVNFNREDIKNLYATFKDICFDVLYDYSENWDPKHSSGATLFTYARNEIKRRLFLETNPGMTENEIKNYNKIHNAIEYYEEKYNSEFTETDSSINELSCMSGLSVKVIKKTLLIKREMENITRPVFFSNSINEDEDHQKTYDIADMSLSPERELEIKCLRQYLLSLTPEENAILYTMVDEDFNKTSEREGVRLLKEKGFDIGRGTLNRKREELKRKLGDFYYGCAA